MLINLVKAVLESASWPTEVLTGRYTFKVGRNTRNVADDPMEHVEKKKALAKASFASEQLNPPVSML